MHLKNLSKLCLAVAMLLPSIAARADDIPAAVLTSDSTGNMTLTFKFVADTTTLVTTGEGAYALPPVAYKDDGSLSSSMPGWDKSSTRDKITSVVIDSSFAAARPTSCCYWFYALRNITKITGLEYLNTSNVKNMNSMFMNCSSLTQIDVSHFVTDSVENMVSVFDGCSVLASVDVTGFNTSRVKDFSRMFCYDYALTSLDLSRFDLKSATGSRPYYRLLMDCKALKRLKVGNNEFPTAGAYDPFEGVGTTSSPCRLVIGQDFDRSILGTKQGGYYLWNGGYFSGPQVDIPIPDGYSPAVRLSEDGTTLTFTIVPDSTLSAAGTYAIPEGRVAPGWSAVAAGIQKVVADTAFASCQLTSMYKWFYGTAVNDIEGLENLNTWAVTDMDSLFCDDRALTATPDFTTLSTNSVATMAGMFEGCTALTSADLSSLATTKTTNMERLFHGCTALTNLDISQLNISAVATRADSTTGCKQMVAGCTGLKRLYAGDNFLAKATKADSVFLGVGSQTAPCDLILTKNFDHSVLSAEQDGAVQWQGGWFRAIEDSIPVMVLRTPTRNKKTLTLTYMPDTTTLNASSKRTDGIYAMTDLYLFRTRIAVDTVIIEPVFAKYKPTSMKSWFRNTRLKKIIGLKYLNTSECTTMDYMFYQCGADSIDVSHFNTSKVTSMFSMFWSAGVDTLDVSGFDTRNVTNMGSMFRNCTKLKHLDLSHFNTANVTMMSYMFSSSSALQDLDLSSFNTEKCINMEGMFLKCTGLRTANLSNFNPKNVSYFRNMFGNCTNLVTLNLGDNFITESATEMDNMFNECNKLEAVNTAKFNAHNVADLTAMFYNCHALKTLDLSNFNTASCKTMLRMFDGCTVLDGIDVSAFRTDSVTDMRMLFARCEKLSKLDLRKFNMAQVTQISDMFVNDRSLVTLLLPDDFYTGTQGGLDRLFEGCASLRDLDVSHFRTTGRTNFSYMFNGCASLTTLAIDSLDLSAATNLEGMFSGCSSLQKLNVGDCNTANVKNVRSLFEGCKSLRALDLSGFSLDSISSYGVNRLAYGCSGLKLLNVGDNTLEKAEQTDSLFYKVGTLAEPCCLAYTDSFDVAVLGTPTDGVYSWHNGFFGNTLTLSETDSVAPIVRANVARVLVKRTLNGGNWSTICLPFAMTGEQVKAAFGSDVQTAEYTGWTPQYAAEGDQHPNNISINFTTFNPEDGLAANHPYIIKTKGDISSFTATKVALTPEDQPTITVGEGETRGSFIGNYSAGFTVPAEDLILEDSVFKYSAGETSLLAFRGYFDLAKVLGAYYDDASTATVGITIDDTPTGISNTAISGSNARKVVATYNISGQMVGSRTKGVVIRRYSDGTVSKIIVR